MTGNLEKRIYIKTVIIAGIIALLALLTGFHKFSIGIIIGSAISILNFKLLAIRTNLITSSKKGPNPFFIMASYIFRFTIMGIALWITISKDILMFFGTSAGLFTTMIAAYTDSLFKKTKTGEGVSGSVNLKAQD